MSEEFKKLIASIRDQRRPMRKEKIAYFLSKEGIASGPLSGKYPKGAKRKSSNQS